MSGSGKVKITQIAIEEPSSISPTSPNGVDPLEALLSIDVTKPPTSEVPIPRLNTKFTVKGPDKPSYDAAIERCTTLKRKGKEVVRDFDAAKFQRIIILENTVSPNLMDNRLLQKFGGLIAEDVIDRAFMPGEIDRLSDAILTLGGYGEDLVAEAQD